MSRAARRLTKVSVKVLSQAQMRLADASTSDLYWALLRFSLSISSSSVGDAMVSSTMTALLLVPAYGTKWLRRCSRPPERLVRALTTSNTGSPRNAFWIPFITVRRNSGLNSNASSHCGRSRGSARRPQRRGSEPCAWTTRPCASTSHTSTGRRAIRSPTASVTPEAALERASASEPMTECTAPEPVGGRVMQTMRTFLTVPFASRICMHSSNTAPDRRAVRYWLLTRGRSASGIR